MVLPKRYAYSIREECLEMLSAEIVYWLAVRQNLIKYEKYNIMQPTSGWCQKKGKGWLFYYQAGHQIADFQNENFRQVILNTLEWEP